MIPSAKEYACLVIADEKVFYNIKIKSTRCDFFIIDGIEEAVYSIRNRHVDCLIIHVDEYIRLISDRIQEITAQFPILPIIGIIDEIDIENIRLCGEKGLSSIISFKEINNIEIEIQKAILNKKQVFNLEWVGINFKECSELVRDALSLLQKSYIKFRRVDDISKYLGVSEITLAHQFKRFSSINLKKLLIVLKITHAISLMKCPGFRLNEIAELSGFTDQYHFYRSFKKFIGESPRNFREKSNNVKIGREFISKIIIYHQNRQKMTKIGKK